MAKSPRSFVASLLLAASVYSLARIPFASFVGGQVAVPRTAPRPASGAVEDLELAFNLPSADAVPQVEALLRDLYSDLVVRETGYDFGGVYEDKTVANRCRKGKRATLTKPLRKLKDIATKDIKKQYKGRR
mmetsp:Transcript_71160/g.189212  ORF Transcript_71160/g.189212 Transcript_71160/m.189212 type:complete len:131 (-) Transcript_71160:71-463(-)